MLAWEEMTNKQQLECIIWDAYKDAYGFRPRHMNLEAMTEDELYAELDHLKEVIDQNESQRLKDEEIAMHDFEMRMLDLMMSGAKSREQALRWVHEAEGTDGDDEYLCYTLGLPYGYFKKVA